MYMHKEGKREPMHVFQVLHKIFVNGFLCISSEFSEKNTVLTEFSLTFLSFHIVDDRGKNVV